MNIHEYQAKQLLAQYGVAVPLEIPARNLEEARAAAEKIFASGSARVVVKSQIHAGGRGKGIVQERFSRRRQGRRRRWTKRFRSPGKCSATCWSPNKPVRTAAGCRRCCSPSGAKIKKEFYLAVLLDRATRRPLVMASTEGGMDIEEVAAKTPEKIFKEWIDPAVGIMPFQARKIAAALGLKGDSFNAGVKFITGVFKTWWECDASLVEINPHVRRGNRRTARKRWWRSTPKFRSMTTRFTGTRTSRRCAI